MNSRPVARRTVLAGMMSGMVAGPSILSRTLASAGGTELPDDVRLGPLKDLNGYFPFEPSDSVAEWESRREYVVRQMLVACGLWPMPDRPAINATVHGRVARDGYTVDRVYFESSPGLLVTGSLYRPASAKGRLPTVLCPHGHWSNGRFHDHGPEEMKRQLESGAEVFPESGRHPLQARCVQLARMGCMVFHYDMQGTADGGSFTHQLIHRFSRQRPELSSPDRWGLFSAQSELRCLNALGIQTWNSIRAVDWLVSRDDCDTDRLAVTGASGGGTQTFMLAAIDQRIAASFPAVMVSTAMQGGCTCENASYLRIDTGNIEFAALPAPRPVFMSGANDWTVDIETKGLPELRRHFAMLGVPDHVDARHFDFPHNYNVHSRMMMYQFMNEHLQLGLDETTELDFDPLTVQEMTVFNDQHPAPEKTEEREVRVLRALDQASQAQMDSLRPVTSQALTEFRHVVEGALEVMIGRQMPGPGEVEYVKLAESAPAGVRWITARLRLTERQEELPAAFLLPETWNRQVVLWIDGTGKSAVVSPDGRPTDAVASLLQNGYAVGSIDLLYTGEFTADGQPLSQARTVDNPREFAGYTLGYNHPLLAQRTHDVLTLLAFAEYHELSPEAIHLVGVNGAAFPCVAATALTSDVVQSISVDTGGFRFGQITEVRDVNLLPGAVKYGDLPAFMALCAPTAFSVVGETAATAALAADAYRTEKARIDFLTAENGHQAIAEWIMSVPG